MIFPKEIIDNTSQTFVYRNQVRSRLIFAIILLMVIGGFTSLFFIKTEIYVSARGGIRPEEERKEIVGAVSGIISDHVLKNNLSVKKGDTLVISDSSPVEEELDKVKAQITIVADNISDLDYMLSGQLVNKDKLKLPTNRASYLSFEQKQREINIRKKQLKVVFERQQALYKEKVIAQAEFEEASSAYELVLNESEQHYRDQKFTWDNERKTEWLKLLDLENRWTSLQRRLNEYVIVSPVSGTLFNVQGIERGGFITAGQRLAEISPNSDIIVETFVSPADIGLIESGAQVSYQIDAYNYNNWGLATGTIIDISKDLEIVNDQPLFRIKCSLNERHLELKNSFRAELKPGLSLSARFHITERTLFDLLYDKVDDWLNPSQNQSQIASN